MSLKVENEPHLVRDVHSKAIINADHNGYISYMSKKQKFKEEREKVSRLEAEMSSVKNDVEEIKSMLSSLIEIINTKK